MNTTKSISCNIGRHHWQPTPVAGMHEQVCVHCGSHRFNASIHPDHDARDGGAGSPALPAPAVFLADGGLGTGGFSGGGLGGGLS
ncbi:hypothetical protein [Terrabacter sp. Soil811]|uniref:hypothetical protein n=1 Tax=Terrabacter sp. Soil811 TaxID=1736419 RepID=UPI000A72A550|nr:hypothetical protein [Terrabacter sp. Soil811]